MFGSLYFGQLILAWMPIFTGQQTPAQTFTSYNAEVTAFTTWQDTP